jgi:mRNA interferase RelE/StbE
MYQLRYHKQAVKVLTRMPRGVAADIRAELTLIAKNPSAYRGDWKPLAGTSFWRLRVGGWRAICEFHDQELILLVIKIGARGDVYK